ncbi:MAG: AAA family ATPase [Actinomycetota bacterium]
MSKESYLTWLSKGGMFPPNIAFLKAQELEIASEVHFEFETDELVRQQETAPGVVDAISIRDFKSVREAHVQMSPLTVVVGRNSSGKSSLIQSLLLSVQHLTNRYSSARKISLNQHLVRLGTFSQLHRHRSESPTTTVGIECRGGIGWSADLSMDDSSSKSRNAHLATTRGRYESALVNLTFEMSEVEVPLVTYPVVFPGYVPARKHEIFSARYALRAKNNLDFINESSKIADNPEVDAIYAYVLLRDPGIEQLSPLPLEEMDLLRVLAELLYSHACSSSSDYVDVVKVRGKDLVVGKRVGQSGDLLKVLDGLLSRAISQTKTDSLESIVEAINQAQDLDD